LASTPRGDTASVAQGWTPPLQVRELAGRCRLCLGAWVHGDGASLQEAADDLVGRLLQQARGLQAGGFSVPAELGPPDRRWLEFLWEIGEMCSRGEDVRARVLR
jgi:hypothetical protein